jgi:dihydroxyacetone kinase
MAGASISVIALDDELEILLDAQAYSPFFAHEPVRGGSRPMGSPQTRSGARVAASRDEALADAQTEFRSAADNVDDHSDSDGEVVPTALARLLSEVFRRLPEHADELRDLDAALGDGDLGITISLGSVAALDAIDRNARESDSVLLQRVGTAFAGANPSTFAALVGGGILFAASRLGADIVSDRVALERFGRDVALRIFERGGASLGDKTVLDAIVPSLDVLSADQSAAPGVVLDRMIEAVRAAISATTPQRSARGRAAWLQDRSMGAADPGMAAYLAFLVELKGALAE